MNSELNIAGIYMAPIVLYAIVALPIFLVLRVILARVGFWRLVWHPALFETALYLSILSLLILL
jgi:protein AaeX